MTSLELEIDALVLHGLDAAQAQSFIAALRAELAAGLMPEVVRAALFERGDVELPGPSSPLVLSTSPDPSVFGRATGRAVTQELVR
jgi:hypothetical protein